MRTIRFTRGERTLALMLTWALPGTSAWALTPPSMATVVGASDASRASVADAAVDPALAALFPPVAPDSAATSEDPGPAPTTIADDDDDHEHRPVRPILECVVEHGPRSYTAYFGFHNENNRSVAIPEGSDNSFWPRRSARPQPVSFTTGRSGFNPQSGAAAFAVDFDGSTLTWSLRGPDRRFRAATASSSSPRCVRPPTPTPTPTATPTPVVTPTPTAPSCPAPVMPARRYTRISGSGGPTRYHETFARPAASSGPYTMRVVNGDAQGRNRATSAEVEINDRDIAEEDDFSATVTGFTKSIASLLTSNEIDVKVAGAPGSTFTVEICGRGASDTTPPAVEWLAPLNGQLTADPTPLARVRYADAVSAPSLATLRILVDGVDRTALFTVRADEASVEGPLQLTDGAHSLRAEIKDAAGNLGTASVSFRVDATAPSVTIAGPTAAAVLRTPQPQVQVSFADGGVQPSGIATASVAVRLDGGDISPALTVTSAGASGVVPAPLADGSHQIDVAVTDVAGNVSTASSTFTIDTVAPTLTAVSPAAGQSIGAANVPVAVQYSDDQALDLGSVAARLDGAPLPLLVDVDSATGTAAALADGSHTLVVSVRDLAGNAGTLTVPFSTDTGRPEIAVLSPANGVPLSTRTPSIEVSFADAQGIAAGSFHATINGTDRTSAFATTAGGAEATLAEPLPEGPTVIVVEVRDAAGNRGEARSEFLIDATAPSVVVVSPAPAAFLNTSRPMIRLTTADALSGVEPAVTRVFIDDTDITASLAIDPDGASGLAPQALAEGTHTLRVVSADRAANPTIVESTFTVDLTPPVLDLAAPVPDGFTSDPTPEIWLRTADPVAGGVSSGIDAASVHAYLLSDDPLIEDEDITALLSVISAEARGALVAALTDGSHRLRAVARDRAGNESAITAGFVVDTVTPALVIDSPQTGTFSPTGEPVITLLFSDERSGLDGAATSVKVDGEERAAHLVATATGATLTLSRGLGLSLADGPHRIEARVIDRAGNATDATAVDFGVDTALPTAEVLSPAPNAFIASATPVLRVRVHDAAPSSGLDPLFAKALLDGVDITTALTFTATTAPDGVVTLEGQGAAPAALSDGLHILRLTTVDNANNPAEVISRFTVDTTAPEITPAIPEGGSTVGGGAVDGSGLTIITGSLSDLDGGLTVTCSVGGVSVVGTINGSSWSCAVPVSEGVNSVTTTVTDSTGHSTTATQSLTVDRTAPVVAIDVPAAGDATSAQVLTVSGHVTDATAVSVMVNGISAQVTPGQNGGPAAFTAANVPVGAGDSAAFTATATDAGGNTGTAAATVIIDRVAPVVTIVHPAAGAYLRGGVVTVDVDVVDRAPTLLEVNGTPGFDPVCSGGSPVTCRFSVAVPLVSDGVVVATAVDAAGNVGRAQVSAILDSQAPSLVVTAPAPLFTTRETIVTVSGRLTDASPVTLEVNGTPVTIGPDGLFEAVITQDVLGATFASIEGVSDVVFVARDAAGNETTSRVPVVFDRTAPVLTVATPVEGEVILASTFTVAGTVADATAVTLTVDGVAATVGGQAWSASITGAVEGPRSLVVRAVDAAGNETVMTRVVEVDLAAPFVAITSPQAGALTRESTAVLAFTITDRSTTTARVNGATSVDPCPGGAPCARTLTVNLTEGDNAFTVEATDAGGRSASAQVSITRDSTAPALELTSSETLSRGRPATATATATDALGLERVEIRVGGVVVCSGVGSCTASIAPPDGARAGDALNVTALATDRAGNSVTRSRSLRVTSEGVVTGTVLDDATSLPLAGATVTLMGASPRSVITDATGRYNLAVDDSAATVRIEKAGYTAADRLVSVVSGTGAVPLDARLTRLADGGRTALSAQGLPNLLPLGYSPLLALHRTAADAVTLAVTLPSAVVAVPPGTVLVRYDAEMRDWRVVTPSLAGSSSVLSLDVSGAGTFALVAPDDAEAPALSGLAAGAPLPALREITPISATATSTGRVDPAVLPPTGGTAVGDLRIDSPETLPSGTVVQADVDETYLLSTGEESGAPKRSMDIQAFRYAGLGLTFGAASTATASLAAEALTCTPAATDAFALCARFPITPSRTWPNGALREGRVHLDLLAGRENARGVAGGSEAVSVVSGSVRLNVAAGSLPEDTAVSLVSHATFSSFLPNGGGVTPLAEVTADFATAVLGNSASLVFSGLAAGVAPEDTLLVARIDRGETDGIPRLQVVARGEVRGSDVVSLADAGLAGVALEGITRTARYVLFRVTGAVAWVTGHTMARASGSGDLTPVRSVVSVAGGWPFATASSAAGAFALPVMPGSVTLSARVPGQSLAGTSAVVATAGQAVDTTVVLEGTVSAATITPTSGAVGVEVNGLLTLTSPVALDATSVNSTNIQLRAAPASPGGPSMPVSLRFVLSGSGRTLSIIPTSALAFSTSYTVEITGLLDTTGGLVTAPVTTFRTKDDVKPVYNLRALTFSFPDADGLVTVSAPAGTFPPGTEILIINGGNGYVVSLTAGNDGSASAQFPATTSDRLFITVTDPFGNSTSYESSTFINQATGETSLGATGGVIEGPGGTAIDIPEGAVSRGISMKLDLLTPEQYDTLFPNQRPDFGGRPIGSVLKISSTNPQTLEKPAKLTFAVPDNFATNFPSANPRDAVFYVLKRSVLADGTVVFETVDHAFAVCPGETPGAKSAVEGGSAAPTCMASELKVKTASPPFPEFTGGSLVASYLILTYDWWGTAELARQALAGVIVGRIRRQVWGTDANAGQVKYEPVPNAIVSVSESTVPLNGAAGTEVRKPNTVVTRSQADGTYSVWDTRYQGGTVKVVAESGGLQREGFGYEGNPQDVSASWGPFPALRFYRNKAHVDVVFEAQQPPPPAPDFEIRVLRVSDGGDTGGIASAGQALRVVFKNNRTSEAATFSALDINGTSYTVVSTSNGGFAAIAQEVWTPSQAGTYVLRATATTPFGGAIPISTTVRVLAAGGGIETDNDAAPRVLNQSTQPRTGAKGVSTSSFITVAFSEPVVGVSLSTVHLTRADIVPAPATAPETPEAFRISGVTAAGQIVPDVLQAPTLPITAITIQAISGLKYHQTYALRLTDGIRDLDTLAGAAAPRSLAPYETSFQTFGPEAIPPDEDAVQSYTTTGFFVARDSSGEPLSMWALKHQISGSTWMGLLTGLDVSDPMNITETSSTSVFGRPVDLAGESTTVVVGTAPGARSMPSNVHLYDVSNTDAPAWLGSVSVANSAGQGALQRLTLRANRIYAGTLRRGIQVIDVDQLRSLMVPCCSNAHFRMRSDLNLDGQGFGAEAIAATIPVPGPNGLPASFTGLKTIATGAEPLIVAAGNFGLALARESAPGAARVWHPEKDGITLERADALDVTDVGGYSLAVVAGFGGGRRQLMVVDVTDPAAPFVRSVREIAGDLGVVDVLADGATVYVSTQKTTTPAALAVQVFEISDPQVIAYLGEVSGVAGRLALVGKLLYGATSGAFGAPVEGLGGVRTAALGRTAIVSKVTENPVILDINRRTVETQTVVARLAPADEVMTTARIEVLSGETVVLSGDATVTGGDTFSFTIPENTQHPSTGLRARLVVDAGLESEVKGIPRRLETDQFVVEPAAPEEPYFVLGEDFDVSATSAAIMSRIAKDPSYPAPLVDWIVESTQGVGGAVSPVFQKLTDGIYSGAFSSTRVGQFRGALRLGDKVLGRTGFIEVLPGEASKAAIGASRTALPADGATKSIVTLSNIRDAFDHPVPDGTLVQWTAIGPTDTDEGELENAVTEVLNGSTSVGYKAGLDFGTVRITATAAELGEWTVEVQQAELAVVLDHSNWPDLVATISSSAGPPSDEMEVGWGTVFPARVAFESHPVNGVTTAHWSVRPGRVGRLLPKKGFAFVAAGRQRQYHYEPMTPEEAAGTVNVTLDSPPSVYNALDGPPLTLSASTVRITGGAPGQIITLGLGSTYQPVVEPEVALPLGTMVSNTLTDLSGTLIGQARGGVMTSYAQETFEEGALRFSGDGAASFPHNPAFDPNPAFAVNGWLKLETLSIGQTILRKAGSYELVVTGGGSDVRLEFAVFTGGEKRTASIPLTSQQLDMWLPYSARVFDGRVSLSLDVVARPVVGQVIGGPIDKTTAPVVFGEGLQGFLSEVAFYDMAKAPMMLFGNGSTAANVILNHSGEGSVEVRAGPVGVSEFMRNSTPAFRSMFEQRLLTGDLRVVEPDHPTDLIVEQFKLLLPSVKEQCVNALATGEPEGLFGFFCEIYTGFVPVAGELQSVRDLYYVGRNAIQSKPVPGDRLKATLAVIGLIPFASGAVKAFRSAPRTLSGTRVLGRVGAAALREGARVIENLPSVPVDRALMEIADSGSDAAKRAFRVLFGACVVAAMAAPVCLQGIDPSFWPRLGAVQSSMGGEALILKLADGLASGRFLAQDVERAIALLEDLNVAKRLVPGVGAMPRGLSEDAVEGLLVFVSKGMKKSPNRLKFAWEEMVLELGGNTAVAMDKMEHMLALMNKADQVTPTIPGLSDLFARGPGTCRPCRSTAGFFHHLEYAETIGFGKIHSIDLPLPPRYPGRPDLIIRIADGSGALKQFELKSLRPGSLLGGRALAQLTKNLQEAAKRATAEARRLGGPTADATSSELLAEMPIYVFRGQDNPAVRAQLLGRIAKHPAYAQLAGLIAAPNSPYVKFLGQPTF